MFGSETSSTHSVDMTRMLSSCVRLFGDARLMSSVSLWQHWILKSPVSQSDVVLLGSFSGGNPPADDHFLLRENICTLFAVVWLDFINSAYFHKTFIRTVSFNDLISFQKFIKTWSDQSTDRKLIRNDSDNQHFSHLLMKSCFCSLLSVSPVCQIMFKSDIWIFGHFSLMF